MGTLMIRCPNTGCSISTGIQAERASFNRSAVFFARTRCPLCQSQHEWFARTAWVYEPKDRGCRSGNLARSDKRSPALSMQQLKWMIVVSFIAAAAVTAGYAGKPADAPVVSSRAAGMNIVFPRLPQSAGGAIVFPEVNRATKGRRLRFVVFDEEPVRAMERKGSQRDNSFQERRTPREAEKKLIAHCEPVISRIVAFDSPNVSGRCLA